MGKIAMVWGPSLGSMDDRVRFLGCGLPPDGGVACCAAFFFLVPFRGLSYANCTAQVLVGWLAALSTSSISASVSPRDMGVDFVGGMAIVVLDCWDMIVDAKGGKS